MHVRLIALTFLGLLFFSPPLAANDFLPDEPRNTWTYEAGAVSKTVRISDSSSNWRRYDDFAGLGTQWIWTFDSYGAVYAWSSERGAMKMFDTSAPIGTRYKVSMTACAPEIVTIAAKNQRVRTQGGTFDGVLQLAMTNQCADAGTAAIWFAPDVGVIKWEEISIAGSRHYEFASGTVEGVDYPTRPAASHTIHFAPSHDSIYLNFMPGPGSPRRHDTSVTAHFTLENTGDRQIDLNFRTGQRFELTATDESGTVVAQWSANKRFMQATSTRTLRPGEEASYEGTIHLPAQPGRYTLRMELTAHNRHLAAESSVDILAVY